MEIESDSAEALRCALDAWLIDQQLKARIAGGGERRIAGRRALYAQADAFGEVRDFVKAIVVKNGGAP